MVKEKQRKRITELHDKYYGKKKPVTAKKLGEICTEALAQVTAPAKVLKAAERFRKEVALGNTGKQAGSRADLMDQARVQGVKNFRVLNKAELEEVTKTGVTDERKKEIVDGAVARWKSGWGTNKKLDTKV